MNWMDLRNHNLHVDADNVKSGPRESIQIPLHTMRHMEPYIQIV
jgi:hypothetical protein